METLDIVLKNCPNYDLIANYITEDNEITNTIINFYKDFVFDNENIEEIRKIDKIVGEYINNNNFFKYVQTKFMDKIPTVSLFDLLISLYDNYDIESMRQMKSTYWV